jgi:hypothetical protein
MKKLLLPIIAGLSGMGASVEAGIPSEPNTWAELFRLPVTGLLGFVCIACVYFMYKQSKDNAERVLSLIEGERAATEKRVSSNALITKELAENNARVVKDLATSNALVMKESAELHAAEIRVLLDELKGRK